MNDSSQIKACFADSKECCPAKFVLDRATLAEYAGDKWFAAHQPDAVALPRSHQIRLRDSALCQPASTFPSRRAAPATATSAAACRCAAASFFPLERMNRILEINAARFCRRRPARRQHRRHFRTPCEKRGLFYPPDPASRADNSIGGNIATNAGGPRCLKYGVTRDYVLGLEVVLADGAIVRLGGRTHKNKTGFDLHRLFVGSEGLLGVVTEATLKLIPLPPFRANLAVGFDSMNAAVRALQAIFAAGFLPCALELADEFTLAAAAKRTGSKRLLGCKAHLIVELDGQENSVRARNRRRGKNRPQAKAAVRRARLWRRANAKPSGKSAANFPTRCATPA